MPTPIEPKHGHWIKKYRSRGGFRLVTGIDSMGEKHTITINERCDGNDLYCSECGKLCSDVSLNFCSYCGAKMDEEDEEEV